MKTYQITVEVHQQDDGQVQVGVSCNDAKVIPLTQAQMLNFASQSLLEKAYQQLNTVSEKLMELAKEKEATSAEPPSIIVPGQTVPFPGSDLDS